MRPGNTSALNNHKAFLEEMFNHVLADKEIEPVRADSGFYSNTFLQWLEKQPLNYVIAVKFYENIKLSVNEPKSILKAEASSFLRNRLTDTVHLLPT